MHFFRALPARPLIRKRRAARADRHPAPGRLPHSSGPWALAGACVLALAGCAQQPRITSYVETGSGPMSRLLMRGSLDPGDAYAVYLLGGAQDCTQPQWVGYGTASQNPAVTRVAANRLSTIDVFVTKADKSYCKVRWSFLPEPGRSYLLAARSEAVGCSVSLLDATDPDDIRPELSARRRDVPGNACVPVAQARTVGEIAAASSADLPLPAARGRKREPDAAVPSAVTEDDLKALIGAR